MKGGSDWGRLFYEIKNNSHRDHRRLIKADLSARFPGRGKATSPAAIDSAKQVSINKDAGQLRFGILVHSFQFPSKRLDV